MIQALRVLFALAVVALSAAPAAAQKSITKSISDGWESVIKDASKAAKKVTKAADDALTPKKAKSRRSVKHKTPGSDEEKPKATVAGTQKKPADAGPQKEAVEEEGPPVPLAHQSRDEPEGEAPAAHASEPALTKQATPVRRLPPPPPPPAQTTATQVDQEAPSQAPAKLSTLPQAEIAPIRRGKDLPPPPDEPAAAPAAKQLPITMIPPKAVEAPAAPDAWPKADVDAAKANCAAILKAIDAVTIAEAPVREGNCGAPAPVRLISIGKNPEVALSPPPLVTCDLVAGLYQWMKDDIQPLSKKHFGSPVIKIETMSDYSCRMAYGRKGNKLSEHGKANALDIRGFITAKGEAAYVLEQWGKTVRDLKAEAAAVAAQQEAAAKATAAAAAAGSKTAVEQGTGKAPMAQASLAPSLKPTGLPGNQQPDKAAFAAVIVPEAPRSKKTQFLRDAHDTACKIFGTSLGPESNEAHRNHFHVDMAERRVTKICE